MHSGATAFAQGLKAPYYAVIFSSQRKQGDRAEGAISDQGYAAMADRMVELAAQQPGYLGVESVRGADGFGITVSYWQSEADIANWKANAEHREAQAKGWSTWYQHFELRVAKVERAHSMRASAQVL
jgi:heme-degrading monooxygenase HmoA